MSNVYNLEPPTKGKVVLTTTHGDIDIELWAKEAPKAVRNFVQLCMEGYYNNTTFHRIIHGFMIQCGDPTGTGTGGESIYGGPFADEFHSRLRFSHRGIVAMANPNERNANGSQFFITLDKTEHLEKKHTIFGKVTGDTIFNVMELGKLDVDEDDRPTEVVPKILSVQILWDPFEDSDTPIVPRELLKRVEEKKRKRKEKKNLNLLSFGNEAEEDDAELAQVGSTSIKSSHDTLNDKRFLKAGTKEAEEILEQEEQAWGEKRVKLQDAIQKLQRAPEEESQRPPADREKPEWREEGADEDMETGIDMDFQQKMREKMLAKRKKLGDLQASASATPDEAALTAHAKEELEARREEIAKPEKFLTKKEKAAQKEFQKLARFGASKMARNTVTAHLDGDLITEGERKRREIKEKKKLVVSREAETLAKLAAFQNKFKGLAESAPAKTDGGEAERGEDDAAAEERAGGAGITRYAAEGLYYADDDLDEGGAADWMSHELKFSKERNQPGGYVPNTDDYVVVDPLLEKGKGKWSKEKHLEKKRNNAWAGGSKT